MGVIDSLGETANWVRANTKRDEVLDFLVTKGFSTSYRSFFFNYAAMQGRNRFDVEDVRLIGAMHQHLADIESEARLLFDIPPQTQFRVGFMDSPLPKVVVIEQKVFERDVEGAMTKLRELRKNFPITHLEVYLGKVEPCCAVSPDWLVAVIRILQPKVLTLGAGCKKHPHPFIGISDRVSLISKIDSFGIPLEIKIYAWGNQLNAREEAIPFGNRKHVKSITWITPPDAWIITQASTAGAILFPQEVCSDFVRGLEEIGVIGYNLTEGEEDLVTKVWWPSDLQCLVDHLPDGLKIFRLSGVKVDYKGLSETDLYEMITKLPKSVTTLDLEDTGALPRINYAIRRIVVEKGAPNTSLTNLIVRDNRPKILASLGTFVSELLQSDYFCALRTIAIGNSPWYTTVGDQIRMCLELQNDRRYGEKISF